MRGLPSPTSASTLARPEPYPGKTRQDQAELVKAGQIPRHPPTHNSDVNAKSSAKPIPSPRVTMAAKSPEKVFPEFNTVFLRMAMGEIPETYLELVLIKESLDSINRNLSVGLNPRRILDALRDRFIEFRQTNWQDSLLHIKDDFLIGKLELFLFQLAVAINDALEMSEAIAEAKAANAGAAAAEARAIAEAEAVAATEAEAQAQAAQAARAAQAAQAARAAQAA
jgi:hypothetical protein